MTKIEIKEATELILEVGRILLANGSTTNRVENMMLKVAKCLGYAQTHSFVTPTGIFLTVSDGKKEHRTNIYRVQGRQINLGKITALSRMVQEMESTHCDVSMDKMSISKLRAKLFRVEHAQNWPTWFQIFSGGTTASFFCLLFGGSWLEFGVAYAVGILASLSMHFLGMLRLNQYLLNTLGAMLIVLFTKTFDIWVPYIKIDNIIIGGIMLLLPGLAIVNAIRDTMSGDLVSGVARAVEALFIAVAIATGSGVMLKLWVLLGGT